MPSYSTPPVDLCGGIMQSLQLQWWWDFLCVSALKSSLTTRLHQSSRRWADFSSNSAKQDGPDPCWPPGEEKEGGVSGGRNTGGMWDYEHYLLQILKVRLLTLQRSDREGGVGVGGWQTKDLRSSGRDGFHMNEESEQRCASKLEEEEDAEGGRTKGEGVSVRARALTSIRALRSTLIINKILEMRAYQAGINHWGLLSERMAPWGDKRQADVWEGREEEWRREQEEERRNDRRTQGRFFIRFGLNLRGKVLKLELWKRLQGRSGNRRAKASCSCSAQEASPSITITWWAGLVHKPGSDTALSGPAFFPGIPLKRTHVNFTRFHETTWPRLAFTSWCLSSSRSGV